MSKYCERECENKECPHNKIHLKNLRVGEYKVVTAIKWSKFYECEKGR